jgi:hypothetical protein
MRQVKPTVRELLQQVKEVTWVGIAIKRYRSSKWWRRATVAESESSPVFHDVGTPERAAERSDVTGLTLMSSRYRLRRHNSI